MFRTFFLSLLICASALSARLDRRDFLSSCALFAVAPWATPETLGLEEFAQAVLLKLRAEYPGRSFEKELSAFRAGVWAHIQAQAAVEKHSENGFVVEPRGVLYLPQRRVLHLHPRFEIHTAGYLAREHRVIAIEPVGTGPTYGISSRKPQP